DKDWSAAEAAVRDCKGRQTVSISLGRSIVYTVHNHGHRNARRWLVAHTYSHVDQHPSARGWREVRYPGAELLERHTWCRRWGNVRLLERNAFLRRNGGGHWQGYWRAVCSPGGHDDGKGAGRREKEYNGDRKGQQAAQSTPGFFMPSALAPMESPAPKELFSPLKLVAAPLKEPAPHDSLRTILHHAGPEWPLTTR